MQETLRFRTVTGEEYEIPANPAQTIGDLIVTLQETINDQKYSNIILIYQGDTLDPSETVSSIGTVADDDFILIKNSKRRAKAKKENSTPNPEPVTTEEKHTTFAEKEEKPEIAKENIAPSSEPVHRRPKRGLPRRTEIELPERDPSNFQQLVQALMELGEKNKPFKKEDVEKALRVSFFNPDRASAYLFSGNIPEIPEPEVNSRPRRQVNTNRDKNQDPNQPKSIFDDDSNKPDMLTAEQKELILLVMEDTGKDYGTVLQTAYAVKFNENDLRNCLAQD